MSQPRAFAVTKDGSRAGFLGEGRGPFVFASDATGPFPELEHAHFTCEDPELEDEVGEVLEEHGSFDAAVQALRTLGYALETADYGEVFQAAKDVPLAAPPYLDELQALLSELD